MKICIHVSRELTLTVTRPMAEWICHPKESFYTMKRKERKGTRARPLCFSNRRSILAVNRTSLLRENISDIFGMGHRSEQRGGHWLYLSPRIEVCLLTCIPLTLVWEGPLLYIFRTTSMDHINTLFDIYPYIYIW